MNKELFGITWAKQSSLVWFPLLFIGIGILLYRFKYVRSLCNQLAGTQFAFLFHNFSTTKQLAKLLLMSMGLLFLFLTLLHPQWNKTKETVQQEGRELYIGLDISRSMLATDCEPNRLYCAKQKVKKLLSLLSCERIGLILFSGSAFVSCPLTADYASFFTFLEQVDAELISSGTTSLDQAIKQAIISFKNMPARKNKLLVLFTDGEDFSHNLAGIKREAQQEGLHIFTMGVGTTQGAPVPLFDNKGKQIGHQKDRNDNVVISRLNEGILQTLAQDVGGMYLPFSEDNTDITSLMNYVHSYEKEHLEDKTFTRLEQQYPYFLLISFFCFALEWLL
ncbi:MAG: VWA domain-containing protein [Candidatus Babeliales bacterium]